jgi:Skp family chaperone for outer membrane proteins
MNSIRNLEALMKISLSESERKLITISNVHLVNISVKEESKKKVQIKIPKLAHMDNETLERHETNVENIMSELQKSTRKSNFQR